MRILNEKTEIVSVDKLRPHPKNPRQGDVGAIHVSIEANGFYGSVIAQKSTGHILAGNHRFLAAKHANAEQVPVTWVDVSDEEAVRILLADNRTNDLATYNDDALAELLQDLLRDTGTVDGTGYDLDALDELMRDLNGTVEVHEDEVPEPPADPITKPGDLWILGEHRVLCGDSTKANDVARLFGNAKPVLMVTDPPYGVEYAAAWRNEALGGKDGGRATGEVTNDDRADWREAWALFPGDVAYVWHADNASPVVADSLLACGLERRALIVWAKSSMVIGRGDYHHQHEPCWYCVRKGKAGLRTNDRKQTTLWQIDRPQKSETGHSTQKPVECMSTPIKNHHAPEVYDPFLGSGTTLIAAEQLGRKCYGIEISPAYCDVIVQRWESLTGNKAKLEVQNGTPA